MERFTGLPKVRGLNQVKGGIYGFSGRRKTTLLVDLLTDPRVAPVVWLDYLGNPGLIAKKLEESGGVLLTCSRQEDILEPLHFFVSDQPEGHPFRKRWGIDPKVRFGAFAIDTFTDWQGALIDDICGVRVGEMELATLIGIDVPDPFDQGKKITPKTLFVAREALGAITTAHVFLVFQMYSELDVIGSGTGKVQQVSTTERPALWGQSKFRVPSFCNMLAYSYLEKKTVVEKGRSVNKVNQVVRFLSDGTHDAKMQVVPNFPAKLEDPTGEMFWNLIEEGSK